MSSHTPPIADEHVHPKDEIHLPPPSWGPIVLAAGAVIAAFGVIFSPLLLMPIGIAILLVGVWRIGNFTVIAEHFPTMKVGNRPLGMWVFLASEIMFFTGLIATFLGYKQRAGSGVEELLNVPLMTIGTFILLTSSFAAVSALSAVQKGQITRTRNWLIATLVLGGMFLGIELLEWVELFGHGITQQTLFGSAFYTLTGFHGIHVIIGLVWMTFLVVRTARGRITAENEMSLEIFGLYWHFVDIVWIVLFTIIYLI